ncbi:unnamed protein product [Rotaria sp. Silwood1]|nr:unnamed protein product [Rotaria sp. Silwood1]CAF3461341.1 unnamed protein product [Rotaria sp. Silwood1]CAF4713975.1 unnamed protein product [Rotaria sp. Silwood1]
MSQDNTFINQILTKLSITIEQLFQAPSMTKKNYIDFYNHINKYFTSPEYNDAVLKASPKAQPKKPEAATKDNEVNDDQINTNMPSGQIYLHIQTTLKENLENIVQNGSYLTGADFLRFYCKAWESYQLTSRIINSLLMYINQNWVRYQRETGFKDVYDIYTMALKIWQDMFFKQANHSVTRTCLNLIKCERNGEKIDCSLIREAVQSYASIGFNEADKGSRHSQTPLSSLAIYKDYFETGFLQETQQYYEFESNNFLANNSMNAYIKKITRRLEEEEKRIQRCLHPTTLQPLNSMLEQVLIKNQCVGIYNEAMQQLMNENIKDLHLIFKLVNRIEKGNEPIQTALERQICDIGLDIINRTSATAIREPKTYIEAIIDVYMRFFKIVDQAFNREHGYTTALDRACSKIINENAIVQGAQRSTKSSELLARYCDIILRKGNRSEQNEVEEKINQIMIVFNYIQDKDIFQKFYGRLLAKRLVDQLSASDDYEESLISKLGATCGFEYASKLQRMFQDIRLSTSLIKEYKTYCENKQSIRIFDFSVMVLTSNSWPFTVPAMFNLPTELESILKDFERFYLNRFNGRQLKCLFQYSKGELQTVYTKPKYTLQVSTYQMAVLLLFNKFDNMTVQQILDTTQISSESFEPVLFNLLKNKVLTCAGINADTLNENLNQSGITTNSIIEINQKLYSTRIKINLVKLTGPAAPNPIDSRPIYASINEDRKIVIQAAIVRIMKMRKQLKHALLVQEVIQQLSSRFKPEIPIIKQCIDLLIEKEYLERDSNERDLFRYLA